MMKKTCYKKGLVIGILVLFAGISMVPASTSSLVNNGVSFNLYTGVPPSVVYVDDDYDENTPGWGYDHFNIIQDGVDAVAEGGTVYVYCGYYSGIYIAKSLSLIGEDRDNTIISAEAGPDYSVVAITADEVTLTGFTINQCWYGFWYEQVIGIFSAYNTIYGNIIENGRDFSIYLPDSGKNIGNVIAGNIIRNNPCGVEIYPWWPNKGTVYDSNRVYHNTFINNNLHISPDWPDTPFDDGYPSGGNYYDDYMGVDMFSGPNQDIPGSDGIGDTPYYVYGQNYPEYRDRYPLMAPWSPSCGDCNFDNVIDIGDVVYLINYLYRSGPWITPLCLGDVNSNGIVDVGDVVYLNNYLFYGGPSPYPDCC
jgi:hypothetical protein